MRSLLPLIFIVLLSTVDATCQQVKYNIVVAQDGSGDYTSIQEAINNTKAFPDKRITIHVKDGIYKEKIKVYSWNNLLTIKGESKEKTILTFDDYFKKIDKGRNSTFHTPTLLVEANDFVAENLTIENTAGEVGQAIALGIIADRCVIRNCSIKGNQDTLYCAGEGFRQYFINTYIEGTTDFIFGEATAVFEKCVILAKSNSFITAASTPESQKYGFVFRNCEFQADAQVEGVYLGRPWRPFAKTVLISCWLDEKIKPEGWDDWSDESNRTTAFYGEFNCLGPGCNAEKRVNWSHQLTKKESSAYAVSTILKDFDRWYTN